MASPAVQKNTSVAPAEEVANLDGALPRSRVTDTPRLSMNLRSEVARLALVGLSFFGLFAKNAEAQSPVTPQGQERPAAIAPANPGQQQTQDPVAAYRATLAEKQAEQARLAAARTQAAEQAQAMREAAASTPNPAPAIREAAAVSGNRPLAMRTFEPQRVQQPSTSQSGPATVYVPYNGATQAGQATAPQDPFAAYQARVQEQQRLAQLRQQEFGAAASNHAVDQGYNQINQQQQWTPVYNHVQAHQRNNTVAQANANATITQNYAGLAAFQSNVYTPVYYGTTLVGAAQTGLNAARVVSTFPGQARDIGYLFNHWRGFFGGFR